jgi:orotate phosphoribosyltransferase
MTSAERFVIQALEIGALELIPEGRELKSGRISPYFFNSGLFHTGDALKSLVLAYAHNVILSDVPLNTTVLFGPAYKGIPLVSGLAIYLALRFGVSLGYASNRKEPKDLGEGGDLIGHPLKRKEVIIVDDVITSGSSIDESVSFIKSHGGIPRACLIAFDRQERGLGGGRSAVQEVQERHDIPVLAAATLTDLIAVLEKDADKHSVSRFPLGQFLLPTIRAYRIECGI